MMIMLFPSRVLLSGMVGLGGQRWRALKGRAQEMDGVVHTQQTDDGDGLSIYSS